MSIDIAVEPRPGHGHELGFEDCTAALEATKAEFDSGAAPRVSILCLQNSAARDDERQ
jgi:hypothetical protein